MGAVAVEPPPAPREVAAADRRRDLVLVDGQIRLVGPAKFFLQPFLPGRDTWANAKQTERTMRARDVSTAQ